MFVRTHTELETMVDNARETELYVVSVLLSPLVRWQATWSTYFRSQKKIRNLCEPSTLHHCTRPWRGALWGVEWKTVIGSACNDISYVFTGHLLACRVAAWLVETHLAAVLFSVHRVCFFVTMFMTIPMLRSKCYRFHNRQATTRSLYARWQHRAVVRGARFVVPCIICLSCCLYTACQQISAIQPVDWNWILMMNATGWAIKTCKFTCDEPSIYVNDECHQTDIVPTNWRLSPQHHCLVVATKVLSK